MGKFCKMLLTAVFLCAKLEAKVKGVIKMIGYVDRVKEILKELDLILEKCDFSELSSENVVRLATEAENLMLINR